MDLDESAAIAVVSGTLFLAQMADPITAFPQWLQVGGAGAAIAGIIWFMYYTTAVIQPALADKHSATVEKIVTEHRGAIKEIMDTMRIEMASERVHHADTCKQIVEGIDKHISRLECQKERK